MSQCEVPPLPNLPWKAMEVSMQTRTEVSGALLALTTDNPDRAFEVVTQLVAALEKRPPYAKDDDSPTALHVLHSEYNASGPRPRPSGALARARAAANRWARIHVDII